MLNPAHLAIVMLNPALLVIVMLNPAHLVIVMLNPAHLVIVMLSPAQQAKTLYIFNQFISTDIRPRKLRSLPNRDLADYGKHIPLFISQPSHAYFQRLSATHNGSSEVYRLILTPNRHSNVTDPRQT